VRRGTGWVKGEMGPFDIIAKLHFVRQCRMQGQAEVLACGPSPLSPPPVVSGRPEMHALPCILIAIKESGAGMQRSLGGRMSSSGPASERKYALY
jgi:hypothetical protein